MAVRIDLDAMNDAIARYQKLVDEYPDNELARFSLGKALFDSRDFARAKEHFAAAVEQRPDWMAVHLLLGKCCLSLGDTARARMAIERARALAIEQKHEGPLDEAEQLLAGLSD